MADRTDSRGGKGGRRRGGGGGGGGRGGGPQNREVQVSKALSKLLRHQAENAGIQLDDEGYAPLDQVLSWGPLKSLKVTLDEIQSIVTTNSKQRFTLKPNPSITASQSESSPSSAYLIRANQGHSIKIESSSLLEPITIETGNIPARVLHGTYAAFWPAIEASGGLRPMRRNHIHCSEGLPEEGVVSGMRGDAEIVVEIDVVRSLEQGVKWWRSDNGVILTEGMEEEVAAATTATDGKGEEEGKDGKEGEAEGKASGLLLATRFFKSVTGRGKFAAEVGVLWKDGEKVGELPEGIKKRVPFGKGSNGGGGRGGRGGRGRGS